MTALAEVMTHFMQVAIDGDPAACAEPMSGRVEEVSGLTYKADFGGLTLVIDEPVIFGGSGSAPNPAEAALAGLATSMGVTLRCYAAYYGVEVNKVSVEVKGALDNRGFFGTDPAIRPGFAEVEAKLIVDSLASDAELARLIDRVENCAPILDLFRGRTAVNVTVEHVSTVNNKLVD